LSTKKLLFFAVIKFIRYLKAPKGISCFSLFFPFFIILLKKCDHFSFYEK